MAVTATPLSQIQRIASTEAERNTGWPEGSRVFCLDTLKMYILISGVFQLVVPAGGGSDPWTYLKLASDFTTSSATAVSAVVSVETIDNFISSNFHNTNLYRVR